MKNNKESIKDFFTKKWFLFPGLSLGIVSPIIILISLFLGLFESSGGAESFLEVAKEFIVFIFFGLLVMILIHKYKRKFLKTIEMLYDRTVNLFYTYSSVMVILLFLSLVSEGYQKHFERTVILLTIVTWIIQMIHLIKINKIGKRKREIKTSIMSEGTSLLMSVDLMSENEIFTLAESQNILESKLKKVSENDKINVMILITEEHKLHRYIESTLNS